MAPLTPAGDSAPATRPPRLSGDQGGAALEFALVMPFLATFVLGVVDAGRGWNVKERVTSAAREGAAVAQYRPGFVNCAGRSIRAASLSEGILPASTTVMVKNLTTNVTYSSSSCVSTTAGGQRVSVVVAAPMEVYSPAWGAAFGTTMQVDGYAEVVVQGDSV